MFPSTPVVSRPCLRSELSENPHQRSPCLLLVPILPQLNGPRTTKPQNIFNIFYVKRSRQIWQKQIKN